MAPPPDASPGPAQSDLPPAVQAVAQRFVAALEAGDLDRVAGCFTADAVIWHNHDGLEVGVRDVVRAIDRLHHKVSDVRHEDMVRRATRSGYVQQHVLRALGSGGEPIEVHACLVVSVAGDRITRLDEYLDSNQVRALTG